MGLFGASLEASSAMFFGALFIHPVFYGEVRNPGKFPNIICNEYSVHAVCMRGNRKIIIANKISLPLKQNPNEATVPCSILIPRINQQSLRENKDIFYSNDSR